MIHPQNDQQRHTANTKLKNWPNHFKEKGPISHEFAIFFIEHWEISRNLLPNTIFFGRILVSLLINKEVFLQATYLTCLSSMYYSSKGQVNFWAAAEWCYANEMIYRSLLECDIMMQSVNRQTEIRFFGFKKCQLSNQIFELAK